MYSSPSRANTLLQYLRYYKCKHWPRDCLNSKGWILRASVICKWSTTFFARTRKRRYVLYCPYLEGCKILSVICPFKGLQECLFVIDNIPKNVWKIFKCAKKMSTVFIFFMYIISLWVSACRRVVIVLLTVFKRVCTVCRSIEFFSIKP